MGLSAWRPDELFRGFALKIRRDAGLNGGARRGGGATGSPPPLQPDVVSAYSFAVVLVFLCVLALAVFALAAFADLAL